MRTYTLLGMLFFTSCSADISCSSKKNAPDHIEVNYSREARELMEYGYTYVPWELQNYDISGFRRDDIPLREEFALLAFGEEFSQEDAMTEVYRRGYRPANFDELLAFARDYEADTRRGKVFALNTVWKDREHHMYVPYLYGTGTERGVGLWYAFHHLPRDARYLAIRELHPE